MRYSINPLASSKVKGCHVTTISLGFSSERVTFTLAGLTLGTVCMCVSVCMCVCMCMCVGGWGMRECRRRKRNNGGLTSFLCEAVYGDGETTPCCITRCDCHMVRKKHLCKGMDGRKGLALTHTTTPVTLTHTKHNRCFQRLQLLIKGRVQGEWHQLPAIMHVLVHLDCVSIHTVSIGAGLCPADEEDSSITRGRTL